MPIYLQHGNLIDYVPPTDTSTEDVVFMGGLVGIPQTFIPAGELGALSVDGVYMFTKKDGVSVNLGDVVKYCGTTKLAQDSNADLLLGVAVAEAEADDIGVKVKINSVLPTDGGGGGGGEVAVSCGLDFGTNGELYVNANCGLDFNSDGALEVNIAYGCGLDFDENGALFATGGGGGGGSGEVALCGDSGLYLNNDGEVTICYCGVSAIRANGEGVYLAVCGDSGLYIQDGELVASGGGGGGSIGLTDKNSFIVTGCASPNDQGELVNIGYCNRASSSGSVILGAHTDNCSASNAVVIGLCSSVGNANGGIAIGSGAQVAENGCGSIAIGLEAKSKSTVAGCGNIVIGSGINPYTDSALLVIGGNGDYGNSRQGVLFYAPSSDFREVSGSSENGGIAYVSSSDKGNSWTISCNLSF